MSDPHQHRALRAYVDREIGLEWERKAGLETKSLTLVTANLALGTIVLAASAQDTLGIDHLWTGAKYLSLLALAAATISLVLGAAMSFPGSYPTSQPSTLKKIFRHTSDGELTAEEVKDLLLEDDIRNLRKASRTNASRAALGIASYALLISSVLFIVAATIQVYH